MATEPTPGDWNVGVGRVAELEGNFLSIGILAEPGGAWRPVAILSPADKINAEDMANAALLVNAKGLLAGLREAAAEMRGVVREFSGIGPEDHFNAIAARFEATIAKATAEVPA